jgi:hypothetical protein
MEHLYTFLHALGLLLCVVHGVHAVALGLFILAGFHFFPVVIWAMGWYVKQRLKRGA